MFELGQWKACCDRCGLDFKARELRLEWTGLRVCDDCWDPRHPQDLLKGKADRQAPPWTRPEQEGSEINTTTRDDL
jgi:hypothetical protein